VIQHLAVECGVSGTVARDDDHGLREVWTPAELQGLLEDHAAPRYRDEDPDREELRELDALRRDCWKPALGKARLRRRAIKVGRSLAEPRRRFIGFEVIQALEGGDDPRHAIRATRSMRSGSSSASRPCARGPGSRTRPASSPFPCSSTA
jgi:hypothetical protein